MKKVIPSIVLLILLISTVFVAKKYLYNPNIPKLYAVPDFEFLSQRDVQFSNKNFSNKISVANFIFTQCPGICPVMSREMSVLYDEFSTYENIQFVSFSVDATNDSLYALKSYAESWGVSDDRWHFLRTEQETIQTLYEQGFKLGGELPYGHSIKFVLIDNNNMIRGYYSYDDPDQMALLKENLSFLSGDI